MNTPSKKSDNIPAKYLSAASSMLARQHIVGAAGKLGQLIAAEREAHIKKECAKAWEHHMHQLSEDAEKATDAAVKAWHRAAAKANKAVGVERRKLARALMKKDGK